MKRYIVTFRLDVEAENRDHAVIAASEMFDIGGGTITVEEQFPVIPWGVQRREPCLDMLKEDMIPDAQLNHSKT